MTRQYRRYHQLSTVRTRSVCRFGFVQTDLTNGNGKIEALRKREAALKAAIAAEHVRQQKAKAKLQAREFAAVGEALCTYGSQSPEFHSALKQMVAAAITVANEAARKFLSSRGWL